MNHLYEILLKQMTVRPHAPKEITQSLLQLYRLRKYKQLNAILPKYLSKYTDRIISKIAVKTLKDQNKSISFLCRESYHQFKDEWFLCLINPLSVLSIDCWVQITAQLTQKDVMNLRKSCFSINKALSEPIFYVNISSIKKNDKQLAFPFKYRNAILQLKLVNCTLSSSNNLFNLISLNIMKCEVSSKTIYRLITNAPRIQSITLDSVKVPLAAFSGLTLSSIILFKCTIVNSIETIEPFKTDILCLKATNVTDILKLASVSNSLHIMNAAIDFPLNVPSDLSILHFDSVSGLDSDFVHQIPNRYPNLHGFVFLNSSFDGSLLTDYAKLPLNTFMLNGSDLSQVFNSCTFKSLKTLSLSNCNLESCIPIYGPIKNLELSHNPNLRSQIVYDFICNIYQESGSKLDSIDISYCHNIQINHLYLIAAMTNTLNISGINLSVTVFHELKKICQILYKKPPEATVNRANVGRRIETPSRM